MVGMGDCWSTIGSHARAVANGEVATGQGRRGYGKREREGKKENKREEMEKKKRKGEKAKKRSKRLEEEKEKRKRKRESGRQLVKKQGVLGFCFLNEGWKSSMKMDGADGFFEKWV